MNKSRPRYSMGRFQLLGAAGILTLSLLWGISAQPVLAGAEEAGPGGVANVGGEAPKDEIQEQLSQGWEKIRLESQDLAVLDFNRVLKKLDSLKTPAGDTPQNLDYRVNALYGLGIISSLAYHSDAAESVKAKNYFNQVIALKPHSEMAAWAALALVRDHYLPVTSDSKEDTLGLINEYAQVARDYPKAAAGEEAFLYGHALAIQTLDNERIKKGVVEIEDYIRDNPKSRLVSGLYALQRYGWARLGDYRKSLEADIKSLETKEIDPTNPNQSLNLSFDYFRIGLEAQFDVGDFKTARLYYQKFLAEYPNDQKAFTVQMQLKRMAETEADFKAKITAAATQPKGGQP